jgi:3-deoxy-7-phosphoheptulonate synthase
MASAGLEQRLMIDFSHANSSKNYLHQMEVCADVAEQIAAGDGRIIGVMAESHLQPGRQDLIPGKPLAHGVSITDPCIGWDDSVKLLERLAEAVRKRRLVPEAEE